MPTRNVVLTDQQEEFVAGLVARGRYQNASEAIRRGVRLLEEDEAAADALLARIMVGYEQAERGEFVEGTAQEVLERSFAQAKARWEAKQRDEGVADDAA